MGQGLAAGIAARQENKREREFLDAGFTQLEPDEELLDRFEGSSVSGKRAMFTQLAAQREDERRQSMKEAIARYEHGLSMDRIAASGEANAASARAAADARMEAAQEAQAMEDERLKPYLRNRLERLYQSHNMDPTDRAYFEKAIEANPVLAAEDLARYLPPGAADAKSGYRQVKLPDGSIITEGPEGPISNSQIYRPAAQNDSMFSLLGEDEPAPASKSRKKAKQATPAADPFLEGFLGLDVGALPPD